MKLMLFNPSKPMKRRKNPSNRQVLYAGAAGSLLLGTLAYFTTHRALPIVGGVVAGMVLTPLVLGADSKQMKKLLFTGGLRKSK